MLRASIIFFIIGLLAFVFGAYNVGGLSLEIGRMLLGGFLFLAAASLVYALFSGKTPKTKI